MATKLIDVSYAQGTIDWNKVKAAGIEAAMLRATVWHPTNGKTGIDTHFKSNAEAALAAGVKIGHIIIPMQQRLLRPVQRHSTSLIRSNRTGWNIPLCLILRTRRKPAFPRR